MISILQVREMIQVVNLRRYIWIFRRDPLGGRYQFRAHGAGQGNQDLHIHRACNPTDGQARFFLQGLPRPGCIVQA